MKILMTFVLTILMSFSVMASEQSCVDSLRSMQDGPMKNDLLITCLQREQRRPAAVDVVESVSNMSIDELENITVKFTTVAGKMASEVGMATNEFIKTDAGKLSIISVILIVFGSTIKGFIFGPIISIVVFLLWRTFAKHIVGVQPSYKKDDEGNNVEVFVPVPWKDMDSGQAFLLVLSGIVATITITSILFHSLIA